MARQRMVSPGFFTSEQILRVSPLARLLFIGLWTQADRKGILEDRPFALRLSVLPVDQCDVVALLDELASSYGRDGVPLIHRYRDEKTGRDLIWIPCFLRHQSPHYREKPGIYPLPAPGEPWASLVLPLYDDEASPGPARGQTRASPADTDSGDGFRIPETETETVEESQHMSPSAPPAPPEPPKEPPAAETDKALAVVPPAPPSKKPRKPREPKPPADLTEFRGAWFRLYSAENNGKRPSWGAKEAGMVKAKISAHGLADCLDRLGNFLEHYRARSFGADALALGGFITHFDRWAKGPQEKPQPKSRWDVALEVRERVGLALGCEEQVEREKQRRIQEHQLQIGDGEDDGE